MLIILFDWKQLISNDVDDNDLAQNIRQIYALASGEHSEVQLTASDEHQIRSVCHRAVEHQLVHLFQSLRATEKLLLLVLNFITTVNGLTVAIFDQYQSANLKIEPPLLQSLKSRLQLRNEFLKFDWPIDDETSNNILDSICKTHSTPSSFRSLSYDKLTSEYLSKVSDYQKQIMESVWMDGNELRTKMKEYKISLSVSSDLENQGFHRLDELTDDNVKTLMQTDQVAMKKELNDVKDNMAKMNVIQDKHNRLKANLTQMIKKESRKGKEEAAKHDKDLIQRKEQTKEAIKIVESIRKNLDRLGANGKEQLQVKLSDIASKLNVNWRFTEDELNKPDALLNSILSDLNSANHQYSVGSSTAYKTDEDIIGHVSGGIVLYGIQLTDPKRLGGKAQRPLLSSPIYCPLLSPSLPFESTQKTFTSLEASNHFMQTIKTSGITVAAHIEASGWSCHTKVSLDQSNQNISTSSSKRKIHSTTAIQVDYMVVPIKCFRIPREEMKLSTEAEHALADVNTSQKARHFLRQFHSHVSDGIQHIGGIFMRIVTVETKEDTDVQTLESLAAKTMNSSISAGGSCARFSAGVGVSVEDFETNTNQQGNEKIRRQATINRKIQCIGPPCSNPELFVQALRASNSSWYVIDRDSLSSFIPIWEIILMRYSSQPHMVEAANLLKRQWLIEAQDYDNILLIQSEIQRVRYNDYSAIGTISLNLMKVPMHAKSKKQFDMLETEIKQLFNDFDVHELSSSMLLNKVIALFQLIVVWSNECQEDFLKLLLQHDTMKSILKSLALCSDENKVNHILPVLANVFSEEKVEDLYQQQVELEPEILALIRRSHTKTQSDDGSCCDIFSIPIVPLNELPSHLEKLMSEKYSKAPDFTTEVSLIISRSLKNTKKTNDVQYLQPFTRLLVTYGWSNDMDGFVGPLTYEGLESLLAAMNDIFPKESAQKLTRQTSVAPFMFTEYNKSMKDDDNNRKLLYNYTHWLVDRPVALTWEPVQRFMDTLRHRLKIDPISETSTTSGTGDICRTLKGWGKKKPVETMATTPEIKSEIVVASASCESDPKTSSLQYQTIYDILIHILNYSDLLSWGKKKTVETMATTPEIKSEIVVASASCPSDPKTSSLQYQTIYDILIHILNYSDLLSQIELFRLLLERRTAVPILLPSNNLKAPAYSYLIDALSFVPTKLSQQREYNLSSDCSLLRIAILSMRPLKQSESSEWMKQVFSCHSLMLLSSDVKSMSTNECIAEIGVGFVPCSTAERSNEKYKEVLVLNVIGNYLSIRLYIHRFADVLMVEEEPSSKASFHPLSSLKDECRVITWKTATQKSELDVTVDGYLHLSSSIIQTVSDIQNSLLELLLDESYNSQRFSLKSIICPDLYYSTIIHLIDTENIIREQDYSKVRLLELPLQQIFVKESENIALKNKNKNNDVAQQRIQRLIDSYRKERREKAYNVEKNQLIKCFTGVLALENRQLRTLTIHQVTQQIELHSRSAMKTLIDQKDEAFNEYDRDQQNHSKQEVYFEAKRLFTNSSVGIEHLWREICHLYASNPTRYADFPAMAAKHLIDGFALELLDGDAGMLEQTWIKAVFSQLEQQLMKQRDSKSTKNPIRIFILSVLGVQSTGKSTLLNLMFGTRFRTSAGMCTRGVNIQLLKAENRPEYDYVLILDTEGIRAPEYTGLADSAWRDNRLATFAVLPADATIILINSEDDSAAREVLPIVMLAYQQSELAASTTSQLSTRIFFVYTRVDMNDTKKLVNNIQAMFIDLKNNAGKLQKDSGSQDNQIGNYVLFRDFRVKAENGDVGGKESDIRFLGKVKKSDVPPDDVPDTDYGDLVTQLNEYLYTRVVSRSSDGQQWKARELSTFVPYIDSIWQCIMSVDFTLSFKSVMERLTYDKLQAYCISQRTKLASLFSQTYDEIETKIIGEQLPDQQTRINEQQQSDYCRKKIGYYQAELSRMVDVKAAEINKQVLEDLKDEVWWC
ncbi:unnamed protein product [Rotaria sp. Silwood2]|nr:unnamed protein product [Rotaria sp. Silwood2]